MDEAVHHHPPIAALVDETGGNEDAEAFGDRVLGLLEDVDDLASAEISPGIDHRAEGAKAGGLADGFEGFYDIFH
jgi:hypothetical protein